MFPPNKRSPARGGHVLFFVSGAGMLPVVPLPPRPLPHVCDLQRAPEGEGPSTRTEARFSSLNWTSCLTAAEIFIAPVIFTFFI